VGAGRQGAIGGPTGDAPTLVYGLRLGCPGLQFRLPSAVGAFSGVCLALAADTAHRVPQ
jgi:hypothetical protein